MRHTSKRILSCILAVGLLAVTLLPGGVAKGRLEAILHESYLPPSGQQQVQQLFSSAEDSQVPTDILLLRLQEGISKRIPSPSLELALRAEKESFELARSLIYKVLDGDEASSVVAEPANWARIATLYRQGIHEDYITALILMFSQQKSREKWTNLRYGGGLLLALDRWELNRGLALDVVEALAESSIPGSDYLLVMDLFSRALSLRITVEEMAQRIIFAAPDCRSITAMERLVL